MLFDLPGYRRTEHSVIFALLSRNLPFVLNVVSSTELPEYVLDQPHSLVTFF